MRHNICLSISSLSLGGAEKQCLLLASVLREHHNVHLVMVKPEYSDKYLKMVQDKQLAHTFLKGNKWNRLLQYKQLLKNKKIDIIFSYLPSDICFSAIAGRWAGVKYIIGGIRNARMSKKKLLALKHVHNNLLDYSISNSHSGRRYFESQGFDSKQIIVMANGIEIAAPTKNASFAPHENDKINILTVGRFVPQKDYETALKSLAFLKTNYKLSKTIRYNIIGYGPLEADIRTWIKQYDLEEEVQLIINPDNVMQWYERSDLYLCSSTFEGLSNSLMESMCYSLPIIATRVGDNDQLVKPDFNGYLVNEGDSEQIATHLYQLIQATEKRYRMGKASYQLIKQDYSYDSFKDRYLAFINSLAFHPLTTV